MGSGKMMVEFFSAEMEFRVWTKKGEEKEKKQFNGRTHTSCEFPQLDSEKSVKQRCVTINFPTELPKGRSMPIFTISAN